MKQQLKIQGMHCASCAMLIDDELEELDGVTKAKTSFAKQRTDVDFDETKVAPDVIIAKIAALGYQAAPGH